ncbi:MAG: TRIC cation channel family protein [Paracraurococcus sp.]
MFSTSSADAGRAARLFLLCDLGGTAVFAIEGAHAAALAGLDLLGGAVLAFLVALGGGIARDILLGDTPPAAFRDVRYPLTAFAAAGSAMVLPGLGQLPLTGLDAAGLALFAVAGTGKALDFGMPRLVAVILGGVTGTGGGVVRDVLLARVPAVLTTDVYATAALAGGLVLVLARGLRVPPRLAALLGGLTCFALRLAALRWHWQLGRLPL